jgi:TRAP transporter TAXI family solute receptor
MRRQWIVSGALALALAAPISAASAAQRVSIGTGGTGGLFYVIGAAMAQIINKHLPGVTARAEVTGASVENIRRVSAGQEQLGFSSSSTLYEASKGVGAFKKPQPVAAVAYLYPAVLQIAVMADGPIKTMDDLKGATINLGPPGGNSAVLAERLLKAYGVFDKSKSRYLSYSEGTQAMINGTVKATVVLAGAPTSALIDLSSQHPIRLLSIDKSRVAQLLKDYPFYQIDTIPAGTYKGEDKTATVINDPATLFTSTKVDQKLVYDMTKTIFTNLPELHSVHAQAKKILLSTATRTPIPLASGAKRFFDEAAKH